VGIYTIKLTIKKMSKHRIKLKITVSIRASKRSGSKNNWIQGQNIGLLPLSWYILSYSREKPLVIRYEKGFNSEHGKNSKYIVAQ
jgi:hypothetical protein